MTRLGDTPLVHESAVVTQCTLGRFVEIMAGCSLLNVEMGDYSYCARFADIANARIGRFSNIAAFSRINPGNHPTDRASLHHFMYRSASYWDDAEDDETFFEWRKAHRCDVGHDTWIGHGAIVLPGRSVGTGAVVGAGAVVAHDVAPYKIVAGVPARSVRDRFSPEIVDRLLALAWWSWEHARLRDALDDFRTLSVEAFLERYGG